MLVTPSYIFAVFIFERYLFHGAGERYLSHGAGEEFFIAPSPSIFSTPVSVSRLHVTLLPSLPQFPLYCVAFSATQSRQVSRAVIAAKNSSFLNFFMMLFLLFVKFLKCIARKAEKIKKCRLERDGTVEYFSLSLPHYLYNLPF